MSTPRAQQLHTLLDAVLEITGAQTPKDLAASLGVDTTYVSKLRAGWRPTRVRDDLWSRLSAILSASKAPVAGRGAQFYDGMLYAAQAMAETQARLISEARAGLAAKITPREVLEELDEGEQLLDAAQEHLQAKEARQTPRRRRA